MDFTSMKKVKMYSDNIITSEDEFYFLSIFSENEF